MKLYEFEGKNLFEKYDIPVPERCVLKNPKEKISFAGPYVLKVQILSGDRKKVGGIVFANNASIARQKLCGLFGKKIRGEIVREVMIEKKMPIAREFYASLSYDADLRSPVLAVSTKGGSGITRAKVFKVDPLDGLPAYRAREMLKAAGFASADIMGLATILRNLFRLFSEEYALLAEINPLAKISEGTFIAADAKIILDDEKIAASERRYLEMDGDIAILASGGGASLLNIDMLMLAHGKPANYTEYSGNPPADIVRDLTKRVLSKKGLRGAWVVGGTANFTDIYETMRGFAQGLTEIRPKPTYPIVIRRDGPRQKDAIAMLHDLAKKEHYDFHIYGSEISMAESAKIMVKLMHAKKK